MLSIGPAFSNKLWAVTRGKKEEIESYKVSQLNSHQIFRREEEGKRKKFLQKFCPLFYKQVITSLLWQFWENFENMREINP